MMKKGISPLIATVLLIGLVVSLVTVVTLWGRQYIMEKANKEGKLSEKKLLCNSIQINIVNSYQIGNKGYITIKNTKDTKIGKFTFRIEGQKTEPKESFDALDSLAVKQYNMTFTEDEIKLLDKIDVIPWLKVAPGYYIPCSEQHITSLVSRG